MSDKKEQQPVSETDTGTEPENIEGALRDGTGISTTDSGGGVSSADDEGGISSGGGIGS